jgi:hypothetical protein
MNKSLKIVLARVRKFDRLPTKNSNRVLDISGRGTATKKYSLLVQ